jgi:hypothetical protein
MITGLFCGLLIFPAGPARAADQLREVNGTPFFTECHPWLEAHALTDQDETMFAAAQLLGRTVVNISGISLTWPKSKLSCSILAGQYGDMRNSSGEELATSICVSGRENSMQIVPLDGSMRSSGFLSKLTIWPISRSADARLVILASFSNGYEDATVSGFSIDPDGTVEEISTGNAHSQWGEFQVADLDGNGSYELLCYRNLDGQLGGLSYRSVRAYDPATNAYTPAAEQHRRFFELQLNWLDWVISTRDAIVANPNQYYREQGNGNFYSATFNGEEYGFDTIVFIDNPEFSREQSQLARDQARDAFRRVKQYRDELTAWLAGGDMPATWGMP